MKNPSWADRFPRIFELYSGSVQGAPGNYFEFEQVQSGLVDGEAFFVRLEQILVGLDAVAWQVFKARTIPYVHKVDGFGYSKQLFERFHEAEGYIALKEDGCQDIEFIPEDTGRPMPDLQARDGGRIVLMEVKTVNESDEQKRYFETPLDTREAVRVDRKIPLGLQDKLKATIVKASTQLHSIHDPAAYRRIAYLFVRLDFHIRAVDDLSDFLGSQKVSGIEIRWRALEP